MLTILRYNSKSAFLQTPSRISAWMVVQALLTKPILTKRLFVQSKLSRSKTLRDSSELFAISALATATAATLFIRPSFDLKAGTNICTFLLMVVVGDDLTIRQFCHAIFQ